MAGAVYLLCALTSFLCAVLSLRGYRAQAVNLLFWTSLCFFGFAIENVLLYCDRVVVPDIDLSLARSIARLVSLLLLIYGLVWDSN